MRSILDTRTEADLITRLGLARRASAPAMVGALAAAMRELEATAGCATEQDLQALGFTAAELHQFGARARRQAFSESTREVDP